MDLFNGTLSKRASGPFYEMRANVFFRASISRLAHFARGPLFFHLESGGGGKGYSAPSKKVGGHAPRAPNAVALVPESVLLSNYNINMNI